MDVLNLFRRYFFNIIKSFLILFLFLSNYCFIVYIYNGLTLVESLYRFVLILIDFIPIILIISFSFYTSFVFFNKLSKYLLFILPAIIISLLLYTFFYFYPTNYSIDMIKKIKYFNIQPKDIQSSLLINSDGNILFGNNKYPLIYFKDRYINIIDQSYIGDNITFKNKYILSNNILIKNQNLVTINNETLILKAQDNDIINNIYLDLINHLKLINKYKISNSIYYYFKNILLFLSILLIAGSFSFIFKNKDLAILEYSGIFFLDILLIFIYRYFLSIIIIFDELIKNNILKFIIPNIVILTISILFMIISFFLNNKGENYE